VWNIALGFHVSTLAANSAFVFPRFQVTVEVGPCAVARVLGSDSPIRVKRVVDTRRGMAQTAVVRDFSQVRLVEVKKLELVIRNGPALAKLSSASACPAWAQVELPLEPAEQPAGSSATTGVLAMVPR